MTKKRLSCIILSVVGTILIISQIISGKAFMPNKRHSLNERSHKISRRSEPEFYWVSIAVQGVGVMVIIVFSTRD